MDRTTIPTPDEVAAAKAARDAAKLSSSRAEQAQTEALYRQLLARRHREDWA